MCLWCQQWHLSGIHDQNSMIMKDILIYYNISWFCIVLVELACFFEAFSSQRCWIIKAFLTPGNKLIKWKTDAQLVTSPVHIRSHTTNKPWFLYFDCPNAQNSCHVVPIPSIVGQRDLIRDWRISRHIMCHRTTMLEQPHHLHRRGR